MRTKIETNKNGSVTISYQSIGYEYEDVRVERTFFCSSGGGYVHEHDGTGRNPQVCYGLSDRGITLFCKSPEKLPDIIRREYRSMRRAEKKEA